MRRISLNNIVGNKNLFLKVNNIFGKQIMRYEGKSKDVNQQLQKESLNWDKGVYFIQIQPQKGEKSITKKVVKF